MGLLSLGFDSRAGLYARLIQIRARPMPKKQARATGRVIVFFMAGFLSEIPVRGANTTSHNLCHLAMDGAMNVVTFYTSAGLYVLALLLTNSAGQVSKYSLVGLVGDG